MAAPIGVNRRTARIGNRWIAMPGLLVVALCIALGLGHDALAEAVAVHGRAHDPSSIFVIAKNQNRNQVHYGVRLDASCHVIGAQPVYGYWRMFERNGEIEPLLAQEIPAYGVDPVQRVERNGDTTTIETRLKAAPDRPVFVTVKSVGGRCETEAWTSIAGGEARLRWIYVRFLWPFGVDYILLHGVRSAEGPTVEERI